MDMLEELLALTCALVRIDSTNPGKGEEEAADYIVNWLQQETGIKAKKEYWAPGRCNVIAEIPCSTSALPPLLVSGHMDTVPLGNSWTVAPLSGTQKNGRLYGRGAADMKSGIALAMLLFREAAKKEKLSRKLIFAATSDEESGMNGAELLVKNGYADQNTWVLDLDSVDEKIIQGHKGKCWYKVMANGKACHSMNPSQGADAIAAMAEAISSFRKQLESYPPDPEFGSSSVCFGRITGGSSITTVPDRGELLVDVRIAPPVCEVDCDDMWDQAIKTAVKEVPGVSITYERLSSRPWVRRAPDAPLIKALQKAVQEETGESCTSGVMSGYTDSGLIAALTGNPNCASYGVHGVNLHAADEYVNISSLKLVFCVVRRFFQNILYM